MSALALVEASVTAVRVLPSGDFGGTVKVGVRVLEQEHRWRTARER
jgi:hypothetical protein